MVIRAIIAVVILGLSGFYAGLLGSGRAVVQELPPLEQLPREVAGWESEELEASEVTARILAADRMLHRRYWRADGAAVSLFVAYFADQQVNSQIHSPRNCIPGGGWKVDTLERCTLSLNGSDQPAARMRMHRRGQSQQIYYWFSTHGKETANEYALKLEQVKNSILRRPANAAFIRYGALAADSLALHEVMTLLDPPLRRILGEVDLP